MTDKIKNKCGRPPKSAALKRSKQVNISMTEAEYLNLKNAALSVNLPLVDFTHRLILEHKVEVLTPEYLADVKFFNKTFANVNTLLLGVRANNINVETAAGDFKYYTELLKLKISKQRGKY